jgi:hypothetical protein
MVLVFNLLAATPGHFNLRLFLFFFSLQAWVFISGTGMVGVGCGMWSVECGVWCERVSVFVC